MKKTLLFVACIFAFVSFALAQGNKISWGAEFDTKEKVDNLVGETEEAVFGLDAAELGVYKTLFIFDSKNLNLTQEMKLDLPKIEGKRPKAVGAKVFGGKCYIFALVGSNLYAFSVDAKGVLGSNPIKVFEHDGISINRVFLFQLSDDKSHLLVSLVDLISEKWGEAYSPKVSKVFDEEFKLINSVEPKMKIAEKEFTIKFQSAVVDNNGNLFFIFNKGNLTSLLSYEVFNYTVDKQVFSYSIDPAKVLSKAKGASAISMEFSVINSEGDLCIGGYYSENIKVGLFEVNDPRGTFYCKIDNDNNKIVFSEVVPFSQETKTEAAGGNEDLTSKRLFTQYFSTKKVIVKDDGGLVLVSENFYANTYYLYGTVLIISFAKSGEVEWTKVIPKTQYTTKESKSIYFSVGVGSDGKSINTYYNDNSIGSVATNVKDFKQARKEDIEDLKFTLVRVGYDGKDFEKKELGNALNDGVGMCPKSSIDGKDGGMLLLGEYKKAKKLGRLKL